MQAVDWEGGLAGLEDDEREVLQRFKALLTCGLCNGIFNEPHQLDCNHVFCKSCIIEQLAGAGQSQCPSCGVPAAPGDMVKHFQLRDAVEAWQTLSFADGTPASRPGPDDDDGATRRGTEAAETTTVAPVLRVEADGSERADEGKQAENSSVQCQGGPRVDAESDPDWMAERSLDRERPEFPEGYDVLDVDRAENRPPTKGADVRLLVYNRWVSGKVAQCHGRFVDVKLSTGTLRRRISRTDCNLLFRSRPVAKFRSRSRTTGSASRQQLGRSTRCGAQERSEPTGRCKTRPDCSDPYAFHTGETQDLDHETLGAPVRASAESQPGADGDQCAGAERDDKIETSDGVNTVEPVDQFPRVESQDSTVEMSTATAAGSRCEDVTNDNDARRISSKSLGRDHGAPSIEEAETQAFVAAEESVETVDLHDAATDPASRPVADAISDSSIANMAADHSSSADILVEDSENSEANNSDPLMHDTENSRCKSSTTVPTAPERDDAPAPSRPSRGVAVTFAPDEAVNGTEEASSRSGSDHCEVSSCPQVGPETQAALEDFLAEQSCPVHDDDDTSNGTVDLSMQAAHALHVKNLIAKAEEKNNRRLDRLALQSRKRSVPLAKTTRPEKQQRTEPIQQQSQNADVRCKRVSPDQSRTQDHSPLELPEPKVAASPCSASTGQVEDRDAERQDGVEHAEEHGEYQEGQSLLIEVPQSPAGKALEEQKRLSSPPANAADIRRRDSHDTTKANPCQDDEEDEHVESSLPVASQYTQASQQTPAPDTAFEVIRETPDSSQRSTCSTQPGSCPEVPEPAMTAAGIRPQLRGNESSHEAQFKAPVLSRYSTGSSTDATGAKGTLQSPPAPGPGACSAGQSTATVLVNETPKLGQRADASDAAAMRPPPSVTAEAECDSTVLVPDSQPFGDTAEATMPRTAGPKSQPKSPAISTVQAPGSPVGPKLGGVAGGRSRYPRSSDSSPLRSLSLASPANATTSTTVALVNNTSAITSNADVTANDGGQSDGAIACNLFSWGNSKKVFVSARSREKGLSAVSVPDKAVAPAATVAQLSAPSNTTSEGHLATAPACGRGRLVRGINLNQRGRGRARGRGFTAPRRTGIFQPPRPNGPGSRAPAAFPVSSTSRAQQQQEGQPLPQQGNQLSVQLGPRGIRRATPRELLGTPDSQNSSTQPRKVHDQAAAVASSVHQLGDVAQTEHSEHGDQVLKQHDGNDLGPPDSVKLSGNDPAILFSSVAEDERYGDVEALEVTANRLKANVVGSDQWDLKSSRTTHLVTSHGKVEGHAKRTVKYFAAILKGNWIVSVDWVIQSQQAGHWLPELSFEMRGDTKAIGGPRKGRESKNSDGHTLGPFAGLTVCLYGQFGAPSRSELQGLVELGGGTVVRDPSSSQGSNVVIVIESKSECAGMSMFKPVKSSWILDSISNFKALMPPPEMYLTMNSVTPAKRRRRAR